jgi:hypothetical protein
MSGLMSSIWNPSTSKRKFIEVEIPWYPRDRDEIEESDTEDEGDNDSDYYYYLEEDEKDIEEGEGSKSAKNKKERKDKKGKGKAMADWEPEEQEQQKQKSKSTLSQYIPAFEAIRRRGIREAQVQLDHIDDNSFASIFTQFFDEAILETIIANTNAYALSKGAGQGRSWEDLVRKDLLIFLAILIYLGLYPQNSVEELWNNDISGPICNGITCYACIY